METTRIDVKEGTAMYLPNARPALEARIFRNGELAAFGLPSTLGPILVLVPQGMAGMIFMNELVSTDPGTDRGARQNARPKG